MNHSGGKLMHEKSFPFILQVQIVVSVRSILHTEGKA